MARIFKSSANTIQRDSFRFKPNPQDMSVLVNRDSKIIVQGFTGGEGTIHAGQMIDYGTNVVGGVTPGKGGQTHLDRPVFNTVADAVAETGADVSIVFVPPAFAADALMEAADAGIKVIVAITEGIPVADMVKVKAYIDQRDCTLIGPNCPGIITAGQAKVGIMPGFIFEPGVVGIVSKSGTLTYEAVDQCTKAGLGQTTAIGIGGDPIIGTTTLEAVQLLMADDETKGIVMIGEIGGDLEVQAARWIQAHGTKPVVGFIAGVTRRKDERWVTLEPLCLARTSRSQEARCASAGFTWWTALQTSAPRWRRCWRQ